MISLNDALVPSNGISTRTVNIHGGGIPCAATISFYNFIDINDVHFQDFRCFEEDKGREKKKKKSYLYDFDSSASYEIQVATTFKGYAL